MIWHSVLKSASAGPESGRLSTLCREARDLTVRSADDYHERAGTWRA